MREAALRLSDIACARGGRMLFRGVALNLEAGSSALLTGPNGVGKSSLLRICAGLLPVFAGTVERCGCVALTDDRLALDMERPLLKALGFWAQLDGTDEGTLERALEAMALLPLAGVPARMLSTGQRKRAMLARVIASGAAIWLLDEPGNGLDDTSLDLLGTAVSRHLATGGIVLAASHQPLPLADHIRIDLRTYATEAESA